MNSREKYAVEALRKENALLREVVVDIENYIDRQNKTLQPIMISRISEIIALTKLKDNDND